MTGKHKDNHCKDKRQYTKKRHKTKRKH